MGRFIVSNRADADLENIYAYLLYQSDEATEVVMERLNGTFELLAQFPHLGRSRPEISVNARGFVSGAYVVLYRVIEGGIEIVRVIHGAQDIQNVLEENDFS